MFRKRRLLALLSVVAFLFLIGVGISEKRRHSRMLTSTFWDMVSSTDRALLEFSEIDENYISGQETDENYKNAWYDLNYKLEQIKKQDDRLLKPPKEIEEVVTTYRAGFYRVLSVSNDVVDYLNEEAKDSTIIIKDREKFGEGLKFLKEVRDKVGSVERSI